MTSARPSSSCSRAGKLAEVLRESQADREKFARTPSSAWRRVRVEMARREAAGEPYETAGLQILELAQSA